MQAHEIFGNFLRFIFLFFFLFFSLNGILPAENMEIQWKQGLRAMVKGL